MLDSRGRVIYVGKAKQVRTRLLSYFRADHPDEKAARILNAAADIVWDYVPSEFAAYLGELRQIVRHRPMFNQRMNRTRKTLFIRVQGGSAPKVSAGGPLDENARCYGPFISAERVRDAVRGINDLLGLRDCAPSMAGRNQPDRQTMAGQELQESDRVRRPRGTGDREYNRQHSSASAAIWRRVPHRVARRGWRGELVAGERLLTSSLALLWIGSRPPPEF